MICYLLSDFILTHKSVTVHHLWHWMAYSVLMCRWETAHTLTDTHTCHCEELQILLADVLPVKTWPVVLCYCHRRYQNTAVIIVFVRKTLLVSIVVFIWRRLPVWIPVFCICSWIISNLGKALLAHSILTSRQHIRCRAVPGVSLSELMSITARSSQFRKTKADLTTLKI